MVAIAKLDRSAGDEGVSFLSESSRLVIAPEAEGGADLAGHRVTFRLLVRLGLPGVRRLLRRRRQLLPVTAG